MEFVKTRKSINLFGIVVQINFKFLSVVRKLRAISFNLSKKQCHKFKPVQVAFAFNKFKTEASLVEFLETCFDTSVDTIMKLFGAGNLPPQIFHGVYRVLKMSMHFWQLKF